MIASSPIASHPIADDALIIEFRSISITDFMETSLSVLGEVEFGSISLTDILQVMYEQSDPTVNIALPPITVVLEIILEQGDPGLKFGSLLASGLLEFTLLQNDPFILVDGIAPEVIYPSHNVIAYRMYNSSQSETIFLPGGQPLYPNTSRVLHYIDKRHIDMEERKYIRIERVMQDLDDESLYVRAGKPFNDQTQEKVGDFSSGIPSQIIKLIELTYQSVTVIDNFSSLAVTNNQLVDDVANINKQLDEIERHILELYRDIALLKGDETVTILN